MYTFKLTVSWEDKSQPLNFEYGLCQKLQTCLFGKYSIFPLPRENLSHSKMQLAKFIKIIAQRVSIQKAIMALYLLLKKQRVHSLTLKS